MGTRKRRFHKRTPPLSCIDKCIYFAAFLFIVIGSLALLLLRVRLREEIGFSDKNVVAVSDHASAFLIFLSDLYLLISGSVALSAFFTDRRPIFGNKKINPKDPKYAPAKPLFKKRTEPRKKQRPVLLHLWLGGLILTLVLHCFGYFGRDTLDASATIRDYNAVNVEAEVYPLSELDALTVTVGSQMKGRHGGFFRRRSYFPRLTFTTTDGKSYTFTFVSFDGGNTQRLKAMLKIKEKFPSDDITVDSFDRLADVRQSFRMDDAEYALLCELFDEEP